jgi:hypothetical protein
MVTSVLRKDALMKMPIEQVFDSFTIVELILTRVAVFAVFVIGLWAVFRRGR